MKYKIEFDLVRATDGGAQDLIDILSDDNFALSNIEPFIDILWHVDAVPDNGNVWAIAAETDDEGKKDDVLRALACDGYEDGVTLNGEYVDDLVEYADDLP